MYTRTPDIGLRGCFPKRPFLGISVGAVFLIILTRHMWVDPDSLSMCWSRATTRLYATSEPFDEARMWCCSGFTGDLYFGLGQSQPNNKFSCVDRSGSLCNNCKIEVRLCREPTVCYATHCNWKSGSRYFCLKTPICLDFKVFRRPLTTTDIHVRGLHVPVHRTFLRHIRFTQAYPWRSMLFLSIHREPDLGLG